MDQTIGKLGWSSLEQDKNSLQQAAVSVGSIIVWGMLLPMGEIFVKKLKCTIKSDQYFQTFREYAITTIRNLIGDNFVLQQDNCSSVHVWSKTQEFLKGAGIGVLPWPS